MTVKDLKDYLRHYHEDDELYVVTDWSAKRDGVITALKPLKDATFQSVCSDCDEVHQILLGF